MCFLPISWYPNTTPSVSLCQGVSSRYAEPSRDRQIPATRQATSQRMLAMDRTPRHKRRLRQVPTQPRPTQGHGPPMGIRGMDRPHPRRPPDRPHMPHSGQILPRWTRVPAPSMLQPSPLGSRYRIREHDAPAALRTCPYRVPQGPPVQRRQPDRRIGWSSPLPGVRQG